ncbi:hypothetical protein AVEN_94886-1 [Araneus ventricosus]|uniref:Uncharacterized protein n=1 Tax=Araneus ventricosus TaxID=182803 RepID=A0A4Y2EE82_ARAVE|nr:hypothetical protein AVEN_94886-1 [Araneus ventricosus]
MGIVMQKDDAITQYARAFASMAQKQTSPITKDFVGRKRQFFPSTYANERGVKGTSAFPYWVKEFWYGNERDIKIMSSATC